VGRVERADRIAQAPLKPDGDAVGGPAREGVSVTEVATDTPSRAGSLLQGAGSDAELIHQALLLIRQAIERLAHPR